MERSGAASEWSRTALERQGPPLSVGRLAEYESWRKERHRPATYVHKWWARRLGTVFRELLRSSLPTQSARGGAPLDGVVVYDPYAGSGTTAVEAIKLGARVVTRDINPIATLTQRQALQTWDISELNQLFDTVAHACQKQIEDLYVAADGSPVLHYFWVAVTQCVTCSAEVELFSSHVFAKHAYPHRFPRAHAVCPECHAICAVDLSTDIAGTCQVCDANFSFAGAVQAGRGAGRYFICSRGHRGTVLDALAGAPPRRRMYAKAVRTASGYREYQPIDEFDRRLYDTASQLLAAANPGSLVIPEGALANGVNTIQAIRWGYQTWAAFFNDRQLYSLGLLAAAIRDLPGMSAEREALAAVFGKTLEHNNLFCSFKGEGTGPVRSIFHNHVLRPERCSVEGNPWGSAGGSGGFADALKRLDAAHTYKSNPSDLAERDGEVTTVRGRSLSIGNQIARSWAEFVEAPDSAYVITGDGARTDLPDGSVTLVVTDPPYMDNVHYSELADFFHAWLVSIRPYPDYPSQGSTRNADEVQNTSPASFREMSTRVWEECARVLRNDGLLVFSFHQARSDGWEALMASLHDAGLTVSATRPMIAEVTTSLTKAAAVAPNRIDVIVVCRKRASITVRPRTAAQARADAERQLRRLHQGGLILGPGDILSAVRASVLAQGTRQELPDWTALREAADLQAASALATWNARLNAQASNDETSEIRNTATVERRCATLPQQG